MKAYIMCRVYFSSNCLHMFVVMFVVRELRVVSSWNEVVVRKGTYNTIDSLLDYHCAGKRFQCFCHVRTIYICHVYHNYVTAAT